MRSHSNDLGFTPAILDLEELWQNNEFAGGVISNSDIRLRKSSKRSADATKPYVYYAKLNCGDWPTRLLDYPFKSDAILAREDEAEEASMQAKKISDDLLDIGVVLPFRNSFEAFMQNHLDMIPVLLKTIALSVKEWPGVSLRVIAQTDGVLHEIWVEPKFENVPQSINDSFSRLLDKIWNPDHSACINFCVDCSK